MVSALTGGGRGLQTSLFQIPFSTCGFYMYRNRCKARVTQLPVKTMKQGEMKVGSGNNRKEMCH